MRETTLSICLDDATSWDHPPSENRDERKSLAIPPWFERIVVEEESCLSSSALEMMLVIRSRSVLMGDFLLTDVNIIAVCCRLYLFIFAAELNP